jgi:hypothetical protein
MKKTKEYWWVSVGGAHCEPAVVIVENGEWHAYTIGCPDPFKLADPDSPIALIEKCEGSVGIPETPAQERYQWRKFKREYREQKSHGYRRF